MEQAIVRNMQWVADATHCLVELSFALNICRFEDRLLLVRHRLRDSWEFPGGKRESGEGLLSCAQRELEEEAGIVDTPLTPAGYIQYDLGNQTFAGQCFIATLNSEYCRPSHEIGECRLFHIDQLPESLTYPEAVRCILKNI